jgi:hypothetical protein
MKLTLILGTALALSAVTSHAATVLYGATLTGAAERPTPVVTSATGTATLTLDNVTGVWSLTGSFSNLTANSSAAHIHGPADVNNSAPPLFNLTFTTGAQSGTLSGSGTLTAAQMGELGNLLYYVNVHSVGAFSGGEIRGQLVPVPEPGIAGLAGLLGLAIFRRRR